MTDKPIRERDVEDYLVRRVAAMGGEVRKVKWFGRRGAPDRLVMLPVSATRWDNRIWVEVKAPGEEAEPHQAREHERMRRFGMRVEVVDSFARVDEVLS